MRTVLARLSTTILSKPATHGFPIPRATTAACEVAPPREVSTPRAAIIPWTSSGAVSTRTKITASPARPRSAATSASKTIWPVAAPGEALSPVPAIAYFWAGSMRAWNSWSSEPASTRRSASSLVSRPSLTKSSAILTAASALRFALRVCNIQSFPRSTVNSRSCMSR